MAGGPSTVELAVAVSEAGGLGPIAGAILSPDKLRDTIREVRERTTLPFAVNVVALAHSPSVLGFPCGHEASVSSSAPGRSLRTKSRSAGDEAA